MRFSIREQNKNCQCGVNFSSRAHPMASSQGRDFMFCKFCGTMLTMGAKYLTCPLCKFKRDLKEVAGKEISYTITAEDIRRELGISLFENENVERSLSRVKRTCENCQHPEMEYTTRQTRSADEGQTTHYTCPNCGHSTTES